MVEVILPNVEFPCIPWCTRSGNRGLEIQPVPATWTLMPSEHPLAKSAKGIISCPRCALMFILLPEMGEPTDKPQNRLLSSWHCECGFTARAILLDWNKKTLYCAAFETVDLNGKLVANKDYMHAESEADAKEQFFALHPPMDRVVKLVGVAPVIGFFALDKQEKKLTV